MVKTNIYEYSIPAHSYHIIIMHTKQCLSAQNIADLKSRVSGGKE